MPDKSVKINFSKSLRPAAGIAVFFVLLLSPAFQAFAQARADTVMSLSGIVRDENKRLAFASVTIEGSALGTITKEDGYFNLKIPATDKEITMVISHVGYYSASITAKASEAHELRIQLKPYANLLEESYVIGHDPERLLLEALKRVEANYPMVPVSQRGFYRETVRKGTKYISVSEAVVDMYKYAYNRPAEYDRIGILKGRRIVSQKSADTLIVKQQGGPNLTLLLDVVKNPLDLFFENDLPMYDYKMEAATVIGQRPVYVVSMVPRVRNDRYPLYYAKVYIDKESLAIMRAEYSVDMSDEELVTGTILKKKPSGIKFSPIGISFIASYRMVGDKAVLHYVRSGMEFKCNWKKRLFSSTYSVVSEMVATDIAEAGKDRLMAKDSFRSSDVFYDLVDYFADPDFWGDYNILEPSESLEHAVGRLRRRAK